MGKKMLNKLALQICYDEREDILYISFGDPRPSISAEVNDGDLVRLDLQTNEITGITIIDFKSRYMPNHTVTIENAAKNIIPKILQNYAG